MASRLTEANYLSRRTNILGAIAAADRAISDAAYRFETGEGEESQIKKEREARDALRDRLQGLDLAWERTQREADASRQAGRVRARRQSHAKIVELTEARKASALAMEEAALAVVHHLSDYFAAGDQIKGLARAHRGEAHDQSLEHITRVLDASGTSIAVPLGWLLGTQCQQLRDTVRKGYASDPLTKRSIAAFVEWEAKQIADHTASLVGEA